MQKTSWSPVSHWYNGLVGESGHYFHEHIILPQMPELVAPYPGESVLDVGCGQGVYARSLAKGVHYTGIDVSGELVGEAKKLDKETGHIYLVADATLPLPVQENSFDHAVCILALQNMRDGEAVVDHMAHALKPHGDMVIVLNHPTFRIPRQSSWGEDETNKIEYRRVNRYLSPLEIPISAHPGDPKSPVTWTYHEPLEYYFHALHKAGCTVQDVAEWTSDKKSEGKARRRENRARSEFPLFLAIKAVREG